MDTETDKKNFFTPEAFEAHLGTFSNISWLQDLKRRHWQDFTTLPMPARTMERWRFTDTKRITLDGFEPVAACQPAEKAAAESFPTFAPEVAARLTFVDNCYFAQASNELTDQGITFLPLADALTSHESMLVNYFEKRVACLGMDKFFALHMAFLSNGVFIHIPRGVTLYKPIELHYLSAQGGKLLTPHTVIFTEDNASAVVIEYHGGLDEQPVETPSLSIGAGTVFAGSGSNIRRKVIQNHRPGTLVLQSEDNTAGRDATVTNLQVNLGGSYARLENHGIIDGAGANVELYSIAAPTGDQVFDQRTLQTHKAPNTRSDLLYKNALLDNSQTIFSGLIVVDEEAQQTDAYQTNRNLLLSPTAEANSLPGLEIEANDVKCSHGATTGQVSPEELFYLKARGIPERAAYELLVFGFFEEVLDKIENEALHLKLSELVRTKFISHA